MFSVAVYLTVTIPALRTIATPLPEETRDIRIEAVRVLSAGNVLMMVALVGVLLLQVRLTTEDERATYDLFIQAGQEYARRTEARLRAQLEETTEKKRQ